MASSKIDFLYLSEQDMLKAQVRDMTSCMGVMEEMFKLLYRGDYRMGGPSNNEHGIRVSFPKESDIPGMPLSKPDYRFMAMPAYLGGRFKAFGIKSYGSNPDNKDLGLPRSILMFTLMDAVTGAPKAFMSANILSAMRTGAVMGLGVKYFCRKDARVMTIVGPGVMGRYALDSFMACENSFDTIKVKGRGAESLNRFVSHVKSTCPAIKNIVICESIEEACRDSDLIYFGTTNAAKFEDNPRIEEFWVKPGATIIGASALLVQTDFLKRCTLVADNYKMYSGWGAGNPYPTQKTVSTLLGMGFYDAVCSHRIEEKDIHDLGEILANNCSIRTSDDQIIMYSVGGMPVEDVAWACHVYDYAIQNNIGVKLNLWEIPELMK